MERIIFFFAIVFVFGFAGEAAAAPAASASDIQAPVGMAYYASGAFYVAEWCADRVS